MKLLVLDRASKSRGVVVVLSFKDIEGRFSNFGEELVRRPCRDRSDKKKVDLHHWTMALVWLQFLGIGFFKKMQLFFVCFFFPFFLKRRKKISFASFIHPVIQGCYPPSYLSGYFPVIHQDIRTVISLVNVIHTVIHPDICLVIHPVLSSLTV